MLPNELGDFNITMGRVTFIQSPRFSRDHVKVDAGQVWLPDCRTVAGVFNHLANLYDGSKAPRTIGAMHPTDAANSLKVTLAGVTNEFQRTALLMAIDRLQREGAVYAE